MCGWDERKDIRDENNAHKSEHSHGRRKSDKGERPDPHVFFFYIFFSRFAQRGVSARKSWILNSWIILESLDASLRVPEVLGVGKPLSPILACAFNLGQPMRLCFQQLQRSVLSLEHLNGQTWRRVPCDVAMKSPSTRIVGFESDNDETANGEKDDVAARWVVEFGVESSVTISFVGLLEEGKVVAVEMHLVFMALISVD